MSISSIINKASSNSIKDSPSNLSSSPDGIRFNKVLVSNQDQEKASHSNYHNNNRHTKATDSNNNASEASGNNINASQKINHNNAKTDQRNSESDLNDKEKKFQEKNISAKESTKSQTENSQEIPDSIVTSQDNVNINVLFEEINDSATNQEQSLAHNIDITSQNTLHELTDESNIAAESSMQDQNANAMLLQQQNELADFSNNNISVTGESHKVLELNSGKYESSDIQDDNFDNPEDDKDLLVSDDPRISTDNIPNNFMAQQRSDTKFDKIVDNTSISLNDVGTLSNTNSNKNSIEYGEEYSNTNAISNNIELVNNSSKSVIGTNKLSSNRVSNLDETNQGINLSTAESRLSDINVKSNASLNETQESNLDAQDFLNTKTDKLIDYSSIESGAQLSLKNDKLIISFTEVINTIDNSVPNSSKQVAMAVKTAVDNQKSEIILNMYPENLGSVDIQIEFNEASKVQSIKILVNNKETLEILEKDRVFLERTLSEVGKTADSSLSFNLKDGKNDNNDYQPQDHLNLVNQKQDDEKVISRSYQITAVTQDDQVDITI